MLFDLMPKARREDLFDFDEELSRPTRLLGDSRTRLKAFLPRSLGDSPLTSAPRAA